MFPYFSTYFFKMWDMSPKFTICISVFMITLSMRQQISLKFVDNSAYSFNV
jgi:hypothetical protein